MYSHSNTFLKWSICIRIRIYDFIMYSYSITFACIRPHVWWADDGSDHNTRDGVAQVTACGVNALYMYKAQNGMNA